jgi:hypothetical protein
MRALLRYRDGRMAEMELVDPTTRTIRLAEVVPAEGNGRRETRVVYRVFERRDTVVDGARVYDEADRGWRA